MSRHGVRNQQRDHNRSLHRTLSTQHPVFPFAMPSRNAAKPQSLRTVPSGRVAVLKYPRLGSRLLGLTLIVTLSPTRILLTGTVRRSSAFLSDHSTKNSETPPSGLVTSRVICECGFRIATSLTLPVTSSALLPSKFAATEWCASPTPPLKNRVAAIRAAVASLRCMSTSHLRLENIGKLAPFNALVKCSCTGSACQSLRGC